MIEEIKHKIETKLSELSPYSFVNDYVINTLSTDHIGKYQFSSNLIILPFEIVEKMGAKILQEKNEYLKYYSPDMDPFVLAWKHNLEKYWQDKLRLLELYTQVPENPTSPIESFRKLAELIKKIERRAILLVPEVKSVTQKQSRLSGEKKEYDVLRSYWIDDRGERKRLISRNIGDRHQNLEKEIANLFFNHGYGVLRNYNSDAGYLYDMVIERNRMRCVVEIKSATTEIFDHLFLFDELLKRFAQDYPENSI